MVKILVLLGFLGSVATASAQVHIEIIDTGSGLATISEFPNGDIMVYDTGHWNHDATVFDRFTEVIGDRDIDLLVISHSDSDHLAATDELFNEYRVHRVLRTGFERDTTSWVEHQDAIVFAANSGLTHDINLANQDLPHGTMFEFGGAVVSVLAGFNESLPEWNLHGSEFRNGNSVVVRLEYAGRSVLFTGDAVGRIEGTSDDAPAIATERYLIDNSGARPIASDVLIAPHHGSDDASSTEFIRAIEASWVIFSAGHNHGHPKAVTAERYLSVGYDPECLLRTDRGDNEGGGEWSFGATDQRDGVGDDSILVRLAPTGDLFVRYSDGEPIDCERDTLSESTILSIVKKSRSGICHTSESPWFDRTQNFTPFSTLQACLASGGREVQK